MAFCRLLGNLLYSLDLVRRRVTIIDAQRTIYETTNRSPAARPKRDDQKPGGDTTRTPSNLYSQEMNTLLEVALGFSIGLLLWSLSNLLHLLLV